MCKFIDNICLYNFNRTLMYYGSKLLHKIQIWSESCLTCLPALPSLYTKLWPTPALRAMGCHALSHTRLINSSCALSCCTKLKSSVTDPVLDSSVCVKEQNKTQRIWKIKWDARRIKKGCGLQSFSIVQQGEEIACRPQMDLSQLNHNHLMYIEVT